MAVGRILEGFSHSGALKYRTGGPSSPQPHPAHIDFLPLPCTDTIWDEVFRVSLGGLDASGW